MTYHNIIQKVLHYIDENLKNELNADILADVAGFSMYHFCRVFQWNVGYSVMGYVRFRRLAFAALDLSSGRKMIDIAMDYGFETHSGFSKAFKRQYGVSPEKYRLYNQTHKPFLPDIIRMDKYSIGGIIMEPKFVSLPAIKIAGYELKTRTLNQENLNAVSDFWAAYLMEGRADQLHQSNFIENHAEYGACFPENPENGEFSYVIGVEIKKDAKVPESFYCCELPPATYAVFSTPPCTQMDFSKNIQGTWQYIMNDWFESSGFEYATGCTDFEYYGEKSFGEKDKICEIYIPVVKKKGK